VADTITLIRPEIRTIDGLAIRVARGQRIPQRHVDALLLSPWPESIYAYESTWPRLTARANLVAVDLPGFGHSARRGALMSPQAMGEFVVRIADELELGYPHLVGPDIGTAAALFAAALHPKRFRSLVVGTGGAAVPLQLGEPLKGWVENPDIEPYRKIDGRQIVSAALSTLERYTPSGVAREDYLSAYADDRFYQSMSYVREYPRELPVLRELLPSIRTPTKILSGARDVVVPPANAEFLAERIPDAELTLIDAGHFIWEDAADEYAAEVISWWERH
jgi:pimeloyl-ACP methyl ester carboxylesterase